MDTLESLCLVLFIAALWVGTTMSMLWALDRRERRVMRQARRAARRALASSRAPKRIKK
ncbi:hypothetical protein J2T10_002787 [Paenarthrobacter nicotinovorans]|uniref:Heme exporter protein D n=1 Tax=Paenarthrobacter nicotinovorans TaxID=29320 RepID=A0ABT9TN75_PAENI|nr:hypothetical protein [Paenarthrobacter nicotinovorans]MDQ0103130.1 hypothetical protein [Paenarthrobacter nicotinovorans]GAT88458.1 hypothetical protein CVCC1112_3117 [Paenarthrobacter nicotinovorans]